MTAGRVPVAVLGATGMVGQSIIRRLVAHPWFTLQEVAGSERRVGERYADSVDWCVGGAMPEEASRLVLQGEGQPVRSPLVLSALPTPAARRWEPRLAGEGKVVSSNASALRMETHVPLIVPEVNPLDLARIEEQEWARRGGFVVANPNCVVSGVALPVAAIHRSVGIRSLVVVTLQALSGAGRSGPTALTMEGNVVPWIDGEEEKISEELRKVVGGSFPVSAAVNRVPVVHGHMAHLFVRLERDVAAEEVRAVLSEAFGTRAAPDVPSLPKRALILHDRPSRPQPRMDVDAEGGMAVSVGRMRRTQPGEIALTVVSHNLERGAAGACVANAELAWRYRVSRERTAPGASSSGPSRSHPWEGTPRR